MPTFYGWDYGDTDPLRCPSFRASASGTAWKAAFADGVPPAIIAFHRYSGSSTFLHRPLASPYRPRCPRFLSPMDLTSDKRSRLRALYAQSYRITLAPCVSPRLLARSSPALPAGYRHSLRAVHPLELRPRRIGVYDASRHLLPPTRRHVVRLSPIAIDSAPLVPLEDLASAGTRPLSQCRSGWSGSHPSYPSLAW